MRKSTLVGPIFVTLLVISINIIQQISVKIVYKNELSRNTLKTDLLKLLFEDFLASIEYTGNTQKKQSLIPLFDWILDIQVMDKNEDVEIFSQSFMDNSGVTVDQTSFELAFISLLPLINASQNLPNRVFYGKTIDTADQKQILPLWSPNHQM